MSVIECQLRTPDLFSGSSNPFRTANGGYWYMAENSEGEEAIEFESTSATSPGVAGFFRILADTETQTTIDDTLIIPNKIFPVRVIGNASAIKNSEEWRAIWLGGAYGTTTYPTIYNEKVYQSFNIPNPMPYPKIVETELSSDYAAYVVEIGYDYDEYMPRYQDHVNTYTSELQIPSYYIMADLSRWDFILTASAEELYPTELVSYISREGTYTEVNDLFAFNNDALPEEAPGWLIDEWGAPRKRNTNLSLEYLTASVVQAPLSASTKTWVESKLQTLLFDYSAVEAISAQESLEECLPYKIKISLPSETPGTFAASIEDNNFGPKFIKTLYEAFSGYVPSIAPTAQSYVETKEFYSGSISGSIDEVVNTTTTSYREIDYVKFLTFCYNNYTGSSDNCMFVGESNIYRAAAIENSPMYRHINTKTALETLSDTIDYLKNEENTAITEWDDFFYKSENYAETLVYRVEKIGGTATGDANTQNTLQNFWFVNTDDSDTFEFFDNQIKFDTDYTYKVYAYVLTIGTKYRFSDLLLSRDLGCESGDKMGIELYDPFNNDERTDEIYDSSNNSSAFNTRAGGQTYGSNAQIYSLYSYIADFNLSYEPSIKIIEIPIYSKTLRVLDNPGNKLNIRPYQVMNSSHQIGFDCVYNSFATTTFPTIISDSDQTYKDRYLHANDLLDTSDITKKTISQPRYIEAYRLDERPTSIADFDGNLRQTIDLKIEDVTKYTYTADFFEDTIKTNKKYYYLFRVLNQQRNLSHLTEIYEAELIDDGGYLFTVFNVLFESELEQTVFSKTAKEFKKIFQLQPNLSQIALGTTALDYNESAASQISNLTIGTADELIWDKTFKIRLTSKKTGRKIDLNITYNLSSE